MKLMFYTTGPLRGNPPVTGVFFPLQWPVMRKVFPWHDITVNECLMRDKGVTSFSDSAILYNIIFVSFANIVYLI